jgi:hypothetical protein
VEGVGVPLRGGSGALLSDTVGVGLGEAPLRSLAVVEGEGVMLGVPLPLLLVSAARLEGVCEAVGEGVAPEPAAPGEALAPAGAEGGVGVCVALGVGVGVCEALGSAGLREALAGGPTARGVGVGEAVRPAPEGACEADAPVAGVHATAPGGAVKPLAHGRQSFSDLAPVTAL